METSDGDDGCKIGSCRLSEIETKPITKAPSTVFPAVVACGYRRVGIAKSGNYFPAFLVAFPNHRDSSNPETVQRKSAICFAWRSKRDFMLLARSSDSLVLPKAALKKVVDSNSVPWRRFDMNLVGNNNTPYFLSDPKLPNHFSVRMKKSLWLLDHFLHRAETSATETAKAAWETFCRPSDTEDLITPREFTPGADSTTNQRDGNIAKPKGEDTQAHSTETKINDPNTSFSSSHNENVTTLADSSRLGQYFASEENSRMVVECALEKILPLFHDGKNSDILFLEPSCGHGDIVASLVEALEEHEISPRSVFIQGYDIDPCVIKTCQQSTTFHNSRSANSCKDSNDYRVLWECSSFFETTRQKCLCSFESAYGKRDETKRLLVCCLGGPPYTSGQGSGSSIQRDLPTRFVKHCRNEWKADVVSFLLPARYREGMKHSITDCTFTKRAAANAESVTHKNTINHSIGGAQQIWRCETEELKESTFFFRGKTKVKQPSIIQTFYSCKI
ncbi:unnamed protein product [Pseudo-nitzschia multistriata]|uniref:DNA methylase adenine-specific domain-containing protein n=1 Tax=Pseudo-nitzschia multistriata TaxID=183589 RepID=A0A448ZNL9_9STRA|nr:unnamed protein product [Pseudo-nitzschia multistriata]